MLRRRDCSALRTVALVGALAVVELQMVTRIGLQRMVQEELGAT